jgi:DNA mismatch repair protein MutH
MQRPTLEDVHRLVQGLPSLHCPKTSNKGLLGLLLERLTGIPQTSAQLDCVDGEVKSFPLKRLKNGTLVPKETIAVTMLNKDRLSEEATFASSHCGTKLNRVLYIPYLREGTVVHFFPPSDVRMTDAMCEALSADYTAIRTGFLEHSALTSATGVYLQNRTKGAGRGAPKTRAFYLRKKFIEQFIPKTW